MGHFIVIRAEWEVRATLLIVVMFRLSKQKRDCLVQVWFIYGGIEATQVILSHIRLGGVLC